MFIWIFIFFNSQCWMTFKEVSMITWKRNDSSSQGSTSCHSYFIVCRKLVHPSLKIFLSLLQTIKKHFNIYSYEILSALNSDFNGIF